MHAFHTPLFYLYKNTLSGFVPQFDRVLLYFQNCLVPGTRIVRHQNCQNCLVSGTNVMSTILEADHGHVVELWCFFYEAVHGCANSGEDVLRGAFTQ